MRSVLSGGLLSAVILFDLGSGANAQPVERSGNVYHKAVCGGVARLNARCHAHVVTDRAGRLIYDPQVVVRLQALQDEYFANSDLLTLEEWGRRPRLTKVCQNVARLVDSVL